MYPPCLTASVFLNHSSGRKTVLGLIMLIMVLIAATLTGCRHATDTHRKLDIAESLMEEYPDSALNIIEAMTPTEMTESDKALYAVLRLQALDKLHCSLPQDSLITEAIRFYTRTNNPERLIMADYYHGRELYLNDNPTAAIEHFYKAKEIAERQKLYFWAGMSCRGIADIYNDSYNNVEELTFAKQEYDYIKKSGCQPYINYAALDLAGAYIDNDAYNEAMKLCQALLDSAFISNDDQLLYGIRQYRGLIKLRQNLFPEAEYLYIEKFVQVTLRNLLTPSISV